MIGKFEQGQPSPKPRKNQYSGLLLSLLRLHQKKALEGIIPYRFQEARSEFPVVLGMLECGNRFKTGGSQATSRQPSIKGMLASMRRYGKDSSTIFLLIGKPT
jgi:hypothetical protein